MKRENIIAAIIGILIMWFLLWLGDYEYPTERGIHAVATLYVYLMGGFIGVAVNLIRKL